MTQLEPGFVYKYFDLVDRFVRVRRLDPRGADLSVEPGTTRTRYRRLLIAACCPELAGLEGAELTRLYPEDPLAAEDLLYQLCVSVNPELDIHRVSLRTKDATEARPRVLRGAEAGRSADFHERFSRRVAGLEQRLRRRIVGQREAVQSAVLAVRKAAAGLAEEERPLASLLFCGRTGSGKTELARALARELFGAGRGLVRLDCSEFALGHEASKLVGAPPGYVGHEEGGQLTEALLREPECLVLFDEVEKAHPRMHHLLLQVLEDGRLTDGKGRVARFDRAIVVLTSNAGAHEVLAASRPMGFRPGAPDAGPASDVPAAAIREITGNALSTTFAPEFLGRLDETVVFRDLGPSDVRRIARLQLTELAARVRRRGGRVAFTPAVADWVARKGFRPESGAREIRRVIRREIEAPLSDWLLAAADRRTPWMRASVHGGELVLEPGI